MKKNKKVKINRPRIMVLAGYGLNCEEETKYAFDSVGGKADIVHINDLIMSPKMLEEYNILALPGGFSYGDDTGSGKAYANRIKNHLRKEFDEFLARDTLTIGICNGFQILAALGVVAGALTTNKNAKYIDRWVDLKVAPRARSPWLQGIKSISLPIAHGEGRYIRDKKAKTSPAFLYDKGAICEFQNLEKNPNGAEGDIAAVLGYNGRVLGMMPHPERAMFSHQSPLWQMNKRKKKGVNPNVLSGQGDGILLFKNAIEYFRK